jgi:hypothetical protein
METVKVKEKRKTPVKGNDLYIEGGNLYVKGHNLYPKKGGERPGRFASILNSRIFRYTLRALLFIGILLLVMLLFPKEAQ